VTTQAVNEWLEIAQIYARARLAMM